MVKFIQRYFFQNENQTWTFYAQISRVLSGFIFIVLIAKSFSPEVLATWYVFLAIFGIVTLCEMGMSTVYSRHFVYVRADLSERDHSFVELFRFIKSGEKIYYFLSLIIISVAVIAGIWVLRARYGSTLDSQIIILWILYSLGGAFSILSMYYVAVINGMGQIGKSQKLSLIVVSVNTAILMPLIVFENTLTIPVIGYLISQTIALFLYRREVYTYSFMRVKNVEKTAVSPILNNKVRGDTLITMVGIAAYQGLTNGFFLIISRYFSSEETAAYGLTMQFTGIVTSLSMIWASTAFYDMAANRGKGEDLDTISIFKSSFIRSSMVCLIGLIGIYFFGSVVLKILGSRTELYENTELATLLFVLWVEFNYGLLAQLLISQGELRVSYIAALGAAAVCVLTFTLSSSSYGLTDVFIARLVCTFFFICIPYLILAKKSFK